MGDWSGAKSADPNRIPRRNTLGTAVGDAVIRQSLRGAVGGGVGGGGVGTGDTNPNDRCADLPADVQPWSSQHCETPGDPGASGAAQTQPSQPTGSAGPADGRSAAHAAQHPCSVTLSSSCGCVGLAAARMLRNVDQSDVACTVSVNDHGDIYPHFATLMTQAG